ncbi:hypothetical protein ISF_08233 [Cordyceps fumosorosea ARSEF 2679]|uniref:Uncharacterized protein n=1 Tax=Cordyceps fumosorosea (strain ARSEF 2679) TaxID=1081104 RepID=A0A167MQ60_CORFA|nr:hypothetical protein ISF_08233 [Cordyceps fumosorosea ARSEF 2679]OAA54632.1 hypothetical protein ISF_08233 [Cordyceps fumosorosea ARSEF 2679]
MFPTPPPNQKKKPILTSIPRDRHRTQILPTWQPLPTPTLKGEGDYQVVREAAPSAASSQAASLGRLDRPGLGEPTTPTCLSRAMSRGQAPGTARPEPTLPGPPYRQLAALTVPCSRVGQARLHQPGARSGDHQPLARSAAAPWDGGVVLGPGRLHKGQLRTGCPSATLTSSGTGSRGVRVGYGAAAPAAKLGQHGMPGQLGRPRLDGAGSNPQPRMPAIAAGPIPGSGPDRWASANRHHRRRIHRRRHPETPRPATIHAQEEAA